MFTVVNKASTPCQVGGYFGVSIYDPAGHQLTATATREPGNQLEAGVQPITLQPGGAASFTVTVNEIPDTGTSCPMIGAFHLTPPNATAFVQVSLSPSAHLYCGQPEVFPTQSIVQCTLSDLTVSAGPSGFGAGHQGVPILFRNSSQTTCSLYGYPGVAALNSSGQQVVQAMRTPSGYLGGLAPGATTPATVILGPGQTASALVEGIDNPLNGATSCPYYPAFLVTPPNTTTSAQVPVASASSQGMAGCTPIVVHPIVPGTRGSE